MLTTSNSPSFDKICGFDINPKYLRDLPGEIIYQMVTNVIDIKGGSSKRGNLVLSNLRVVWYEVGNLPYNLSIGLSCMISIDSKEKKVQGNRKSFEIRIKCINKSTRYQFIFFNNTHQKDPFRFFGYISKAYEDSKPYREVLIRTQLISGSQLILLNKEKIIKDYSGIYNLTKSEVKGGRFYFTNVRVIWISQKNEQFNISVPFCAISGFKKQNSRFGEAFKITTTPQSGGYALGFKCENPDEKIDDLVKLHKTFSTKPYLGLPKDLLELQENIEAEDMFDRQKYEEQFKDLDIVESGFNENQNLGQLRANYAIDGAVERPISFNKEIGVAMEILPKGMSVDMIWQLLKVNKSANQ